MTTLLDTPSAPADTPADASEPPAAPTARRAPSPPAKLLGLTAGLGIILAVLLLVFIMPSLKSGPHDLPLGVVGSPAAAEQLVAGIATFSVVGGLIVAGVLMGVFGSITTGFWAVAAAMALGIAALALPLAGLQEVFGGKGFTIGAMAMMFLGNPLAGISTTAAWLPGILGTIAQILPPGAAGTLVRSAAYFGGAGGLTAGLTLGAWVVAGIVLLVIGARRNARADARAA